MLPDLSGPFLKRALIEVESTKTLNLALTNPTDIPLEVTPKLLGADRDEFAIYPVVLEPGEKREVSLTFSPVRPGRKQVVLAVSPCRLCVDLVVRVVAEALEQAVIAELHELDFGSIPVGKESFRLARIRNISTEPMTVTLLTLEGKDPSFSHSAEDFPRVLYPGEYRTWMLRYSPGHMGPADDQALFHVESVRNPITPVMLRGHGSSASLCVSP